MLFTSNSDKPYHFLFNAEYDFKLRQGTVTPQIQNSVEAMAPLFSPALEGSDFILSEISVDTSFYDYLAELDISHAILKHPEKCLQASEPCFAEAWGWSKEATEYLKQHQLTADHPTPAISTLVNKRSFSSEHTDIRIIGTPYSKVINTAKQLNTYLIENPHIDLIIKPLHGNSGAGFTRLSPPYQQEVLRHIETIIHNEGAVIEPWLDRIDDFATLFHIAKDGFITTIGSHRNICNSNGAFYGTLISDNDQLLQEHSTGIERATKEIGTALHKAGYFGIVSFDSFTYREKGQIRTAYGIDINCRYTMSYIAHMLKRKMSCNCMFYRFIAKRRHKLPTSYSEFKRIAGDIHYSTQKSEGIFLASPLRIHGKDGVERQPPRSAFVVAGQSIEDVFEMDELLREKILRSKR